MNSLPLDLSINPLPKGDTRIETDVNLTVTDHSSNIREGVV
jgi:hypothetical protein